ncbi:hypothetical protein DFA_01946 [Cavenderia fasciculata]|uniref:Uncharacterized protein n=1 Tax=Cavenderia fasciculata TaxID=261658 RepID=F4PQU8_CACFS|nr:uncharacterized protein DFA_01946 [Cavenderia fasciculata]EGG22056.1 hypothetical protein DFA_01946 [Cavenderia fasciculata]|eukprot:XP_004359907.1 hypothetical protein DFA_01946 [Cavenderia fasciculata]
MTCHNSNCIPWSTLLECDKVKEEMLTKGIGIRSKGYKEYIKPYKKKLKYFINSLAEAIESKEIAERKLYSMKDLYRLTTVYADKDCHDDDGLNRYVCRFCDPAPLHSGNPTQYFSFWEGEQEWKLGGDHNRYSYEVCVIKLLWRRNKMANILALIQRGGDLDLMDNLHDFCGGYGLYNTMHECLRMYIFVNLYIAAGTVNQQRLNPKTKRLEYPKHTSDTSEKLIEFDIFAPYLEPKQSRYMSTLLTDDYHQENNISKLAFKMIYNYSMMAREWGKPKDWYTEIKIALAHNDFSFRFLIPLYWQHDDENENED